ncbi:MAG TPA: acyl-CoA thioesterase [Flavisolibacter sp.]|jgi:acyl-CoA thioester hydrolase|nr:acyl-CoA thioesterase [Flavisolibacter sp.]
MNTFKKELESTVKIRFPDCDAFQHLHNSRYIDYMINAREDQLLESYGFDVYALAAQKGVGWVAAQSQISYLAPAMIMEEVTIQTRLLTATEKGLMLEARMWDRDKQVVKALLWTKLVHFDLSLRRSRLHSQELMEFFDQIVYPLEPGVSFDSRVNEIRQQYLSK